MKYYIVKDSGINIINKLKNQYKINYEKELIGFYSKLGLGGRIN